MPAAPTDSDRKRRVFVELLAEGSTTLHLDARRPGVKVPGHLRRDAHVILQYGYDLPIPIPDLYVDERGVRATLSFARAPLETFVPWEAVYTILSLDGRGVLFADDVPPEVTVARLEKLGARGTLAESRPARPSPRSLRAVPAAPDETPMPVTVSESPRERPQLRLVK